MGQQELLHSILQQLQKNQSTCSPSKLSTNLDLHEGTLNDKQLYLYHEQGNQLTLPYLQHVSGITMNLSGLQATAGGTVEPSEVLLGKVTEYASGSDLIALAIPEPSSATLLAIGVAGLVALRVRRKS
jgi:hypothetical protein